MSKTFDNGVICASEQSVVVVDSVYDAVRERFASHGAYMLQGKELKAVQDIILKNGALNAAIVGQPAYKIAELAGFSVPTNTKILIGEVKVVDESEPFAHENCLRRWQCTVRKTSKMQLLKLKNWLLWAVSVIPLACTLTGQPARTRCSLRSDDENCTYPDQHPGVSGWYRRPVQL